MNSIPTQKVPGHRPEPFTMVQSLLDIGVPANCITLHTNSLIVHGTENIALVAKAPELWKRRTCGVEIDCDCAELSERLQMTWILPGDTSAS